MKIVFIQPKTGFKGHTWEALGIGYICSYIKKNSNLDIDIDFYSAFYDSDDAIIKGCKDANIIGFSCTSPQFKHGIELAKRIKTKENRIVFGGIHVTALPEQSLKEENIDSIIVGEGESNFEQLLHDYYYRGEIYKMYNHRLISDINTIPFPDRHIIKNERNIQQAYKDNGVRITSVLSSRGCPYNCAFCCSHTLWTRRPRFRTVQNVLDEVDYLVKEWNIQFLKFSDDTFTIRKDWIKEFCQEKIKQGIDIPYGCNAHVNSVSEEIIKLLYDSGCREIWYGVESGSPKILEDMHKHTNINKVKEIFKLSRKYGIKTRAYFLLGMPNECLEDIKLSEKLADDLQPDIIGFSLLSPFPNNEFFDYETMKDWDWSTFDEYNNNWIRTKYLTNEELKYHQQRLIDKYNSNITYRQKKNG